MLLLIFELNLFFRKIEFITKGKFRFRNKFGKIF